MSAPTAQDADRDKLDGGERAAIALAMSLRLDYVLIDDRAGVAAARAKGLNVTGTFGLLYRAVLRALSAGEVVGARALLVHAISEEAKAFYEKHGFQPSPVDPMMLVITLTEPARMFAG